MNWKTWLKRIVEIVVYGRSKNWWSQEDVPDAVPDGLTYAGLTDIALSGANGYAIEEPTLLAKALRWFDGKKTWTGAALVAVPSIIGALMGFYEEVGLNATTFLKASGVALAAVGALHKIVKILDDLTPDAPKEGE